MKKKVSTKLLLLILAFCFLFIQSVSADGLSDKDRIMQYLDSTIEMIKDKSVMNVSETQLIEGAINGILSFVNPSITDLSLESKDKKCLENIVDIVTTRFNDMSIDKKSEACKQLIEAALKGMLGSLDTTDAYYTLEEADKFFGIENGAGTIGINFVKKENSIIINLVSEGYPADNAGIRVNDKVISIDGKSISGMRIDEIVILVKGKVGTKVRLEILKSGEKKTEVFELTRVAAISKPLTYEIKGDIAYIRLNSFFYASDQLMNEALDEIDERGVKNIVLDLRNNLGGLFDNVIKIACRFVPKGLITTLDYKSSMGKNEYCFSYLEKTKYKIVVLVNGRSASGAEILAGAIQDSKAGVLVGTKTYGYSDIQRLDAILSLDAFEKYYGMTGEKLVNTIDLAEKHNIYAQQSERIGYILLSIGNFYTPNHRLIEGSGLTPDMTVEDPKIDRNINIFAIQKLQEKIKFSLNDENAEIFNAERILKLVGYDVDIPDMILDEKTSKAIARFQKDHGGYAYGVLDYKTQQWLNETLDQLIMDTDKQYKTAIELLHQ